MTASQFDELENPYGYVRRGDLDAMRDEIITSLQTGQILLPQVEPEQPVFAGGTNHCPNSDLSYSKMAATVVGTTPATAGDTNYEAYQFYRQQKGANVTVSAANALKSVTHSLYAANEGANADIPIWNRTSGWVEIGAIGATQYDIAVQLLQKIVGPGQRWFVRFRLVALKPDIVPANVQIYAGLWHKTASTEGWVTGSPFNLQYEIAGTPGTQTVEYVVLAKTDSGLAIVSNVLTVATAPNTLSTVDYIKLFFNAGPGFIEFTIVRKQGTNYRKLAVIRNSTDLQYNDIGLAGSPETGFPIASSTAPLAYAESQNVLIAAYNTTWSANDLTIDIPTTYDFSQTLSDGQFLRFGLTAPTAVARHIGMDRVWFSMSFNAWSPDLIRLSDGTAPIPSISPSSGYQGGGGPVIVPPRGGSGSPSCVLTRMPVLTASYGVILFRPFDMTEIGERLIGEGTTVYQVLSKTFGVSSEYLVLRTRNGILYECTADHRLCVDLVQREFREAQKINVGDKLPSWVNGKVVETEVMSKVVVPHACDVGTYRLRDVRGRQRDGHGMYVAGHSKRNDRGLYSSNLKQDSLLVY